MELEMQKKEKNKIKQTNTQNVEIYTRSKNRYYSEL